MTLLDQLRYMWRNWPNLLADRLDEWVINGHSPTEADPGELICLSHRPPQPWPCHTRTEVEDRRSAREWTTR